ncbi:MAG: hypothetical protein E7591_04140 [Ruminococcaceae bacterium]|nr:hypothetical protein [Oscillospiraceae bacterium]
MANIDLITGFLGAGKTTFIRKYAEYLRRIGESFAVIENEYGNKGIDSRILAAEGIHTDELFGGCICCTLKVGFHDMLLELSEHFDRIIVEPSGVYDISQFYSVMASPELKGKCHIGNVICVVDPFSLDGLDGFSESMLQKQIFASGAVVFSMNDMQTDAELEEYIKKADEKLTLGGFDVCKYGDMDSIYKAGHGFNSLGSETTHSARYLSTLIKPPFCSADEIKRRIDRIFNSFECGEVLRIKGIWGEYLVNCVKGRYEIYPESAENGINIIGLNISRKNIKNIINGENNGPY